MSATQIVGLIVAGAAISAFVILQIMMWRGVIAKRRVQRMIDDLSAPGVHRK